MLKIRGMSIVEYLLFGVDGLGYCLTAGIGCMRERVVLDILFRQSLLHACIDQVSAKYLPYNL